MLYDMRCVFPACDYTAGHSVSRNITLYKFPLEASLRAAWLQALGLVGWEVEAGSRVCSNHFLSEHFLMTRTGRKLRSDAVPVSVQRCRVCFARNCKLYSMRDDHHDLSRPFYAKAYETLTGLSIEEDKLSPYLCINCANRLLKCIRFRDRCIKAHTILRNISNENDSINLDTLIDVSRRHIPVNTDVINDESDREYIESDIICSDELDLLPEDCSYSIKSESIDIVEHGVVLPDISYTKDKGPSTNLIGDSTTSIKTENEDIINERVETVDGLNYSPNPNESAADSTESNVTVLKNIPSNEINTSYVNVMVNIPNICQIDTKSSNRHKMNKRSDCKNDSFEDVFRGEDCSLNESLRSKKAAQKGKLKSTKLKEMKMIQEDLDQSIPEDKRKPEVRGGLLLRYTLHTCDICNYQTVNKDQLIHHLKDHAVAKVYNCSKCYFITDSKKSLLFHTEIHSDKKHSCSYCEKIFNFKCDLKAHLRIHTGEKPYSCDICMKKFRQYNQLAAHLKVHTGEKPHSCNVCKKSFRQKVQLQNHSRIHSGEKPYSCDMCNKAFIQRGQLQNHIVMKHTNEKRYVCHTCGKSFKVKGTLQNHMQVHAK